MKKKLSAEAISEIISQQIISGQLLPGTSLKVLNLANDFNVSQAPVREALRILQGEGYVVSKPNYGCKVTEHSEQELKETFDIRFILELNSVIENLEKCKDEPLMMKLYDSFGQASNLKDFIEVDSRLHEYMVNVSENSLLIKTWKQMMNKSRVARRIKVDQWQLAPAISLHQDLCKAVFSANAEKTATLMKKHYNK